MANPLPSSMAVQSCNVWVVRRAKGGEEKTGAAKVPKAVVSEAELVAGDRREAIITLHGQPCTVKMRGFDVDTMETMALVLGASITSPKRAKVKLGRWCPETRSFNGGRFYTAN